MQAARSVCSSAQHLLKPELTSKLLCLRNYAFKSDLKIKWVRPTKIPSYNAEQSGDLEPMLNVDKSKPVLAFRNSKELENADEIVKKLFSLEFAPRKHITEVYYGEIISKVKSHPYDVSSDEVKIAAWTGMIRAYQEIMERFPRNKKMKVFLKELIDTRKKYLKYMRKRDYKKFEWLLEVLNIVYKPPPNHFHWVTRKESLQKLTNKYCDNIRNDRLDSYKLVLQNEQPIFLQEKIKALQFIRDEQIDCGAEVTVTEEEIEAVKKQLKQIEAERSKNQEDN